MMGKAPVWSEKIVLVGWKDTNELLFFFMEDGWMERDFNFYVGPVVLVLLAEVTQGSIDRWGQVFCDELAGEARTGGEKPCIYRFDPCCNHRAEANPVVPNTEVLFSI